MAADANLSNPAKTVRVTVDNKVIEAPEGETLLQVMLDAGLDIPHYCYHPKLSIDGSCRLCQVRIEGVPKLQISCNTKVRDGMVVHADEPEVQLNRRGVLEMLLLNHPLDCPICDKAGECWLQNYSMRFGSRFSRALEPRRKHGKTAGYRRAHAARSGTMHSLPPMRPLLPRDFQNRRIGGVQYRRPFAARHLRPPPR